MPIGSHPSFDRPSVAVRLWRYIDLPKFVDLLTQNRLWLTNAEVLAADDPHEGMTGAMHFAHRLWRTIDEVPEPLRFQILTLGGRVAKEESPEAMFKGWFMGEEQRCYMTQAGRRNFYVNCWHAADHESVAMWKIYGSPGAGVAIVSNGARLEHALDSNKEDMYLGGVQYVDPDVFEIGTRNAFDVFMRKRMSYQYENEVRLIHMKAGDYHDPLQKFEWNEETLRFENIVEDSRPIIPGISLECDVSVLIERIVISPFAPAWYISMIEKLRDQLSFHFPVSVSNLLMPPSVLP